MKKDSSNEFWNDFRKKANSIHEHVMCGNLQLAFDEVEYLLKKYGYDFVIELTAEDNLAVLIMTPEGDITQASRIDMLIGSKPVIAGWLVYGRRQQKTLEDAKIFVRNIYGLDVSDATFNVTETKSGYEITMYSEVFADLSFNEADGLVATFLDHAIGENNVMKLVCKLNSASNNKANRSKLISPSEMIQIVTSITK